MRKSIPKKVQLKVWFRDHWTCRYCGEPVFFAPSLKLLNKLSPNHGYYHPHGKSTKILSLFQWLWASVDHVKPVAKGGENIEDNYVTSCWSCNLKFKDKLILEGKPEPINIDNINPKKVNWDGFASLYPKMLGKKDGWTKLLEKYY